MPAFKKKVSNAVKLDSIDDAFAVIEKRFGFSKVIIASNLHKSNTDRVPSGSFSLDCAMGGGYAIGHSHMLWGDKSSGKTTTAYRAVAAFQKEFPERWPIYIAAEQFDPENAAANGVDLSRLVLILPETMEEAFNAAEILIRSKQASLLVVDSVDALVTKAELEGSMDDQQRGATSRTLNKGLRKLFSVMQPTMGKDGKVTYANSVTCVFISQMRVDQNAGIFGDSRMYGGGKGYGHAVGIIVQFDNTSKGRTLFKTLSNGKQRECGIQISSECVKNKTYPPKLASVTDYYYNTSSETKYKITREFSHGDIDHAKEILEHAIEVELINSSAKGKLEYAGTDYSEFSFMAYLDTHPKATRKLIRQICRKKEPALPIKIADYYSTIIATRLKRNAAPTVNKESSRVLRVGQKRKRRKST